MPFLTAILMSSLLTAQAQEPDRVTMSLEEYLQLYEASKNRPEKPEKPPIEHLISDARYSGEVVLDDGEAVSVVFDATLRVERAKANGWSRIRLLSGDAALLSATIDGRPAPVQLKDGWYLLVTDRRGSFEVKTRFAVSLSSGEGITSMSFPIQPSGATRLKLEVPADAPLDVTVGNARLVRARHDGNTQIIDATVAPWGRLSASWQREVESAEDVAVAAKVYTETHHLVSVAEGLLRESVSIDHTIRFGSVDTLRYDLPEGVTVLDVRGVGLSDWALDGSGDLVVRLRYAAEDSYRLAIDLESVLGEGDLTLDAPLVRPIGVERAKGWVGVTAGGNLEITPTTVVAAGAVDVRTLPAQILGITQQPVLLGYKYLDDDEARIGLELSAHDEVDVLVTLVDAVQGTTMLTIDGRRLTSVVYDVRNNRMQYLRLAMPQGAELWSAAVAGRAVQPARASDGVVLVPLVRSADSGSALSSFGVEVVYVEAGVAPTGGVTPFEAELPRLEVPATTVSWTIYVPWEAKLNTKKTTGSLRWVSSPSHRARASDNLVMTEYQEDMAQSAHADLAAGALGTGATPVRVELPLEGQAVTFEKILALDERLWVAFDLKGLK